MSQAMVSYASVTTQFYCKVQSVSCLVSITATFRSVGSEIVNTDELLGKARAVMLETDFVAIPPKDVPRTMFVALRAAKLEVQSVAATIGDESYGAAMEVV